MESGWCRASQPSAPTSLGHEVQVYEEATRHPDPGCRPPCEDCLGQLLPRAPQAPRRVRTRRTLRSPRCAETSTFLFARGQDGVRPQAKSPTRASGEMVNTGCRLPSKTTVEDLCPSRRTRSQSPNETPRRKQHFPVFSGWDSELAPPRGARDGQGRGQRYRHLARSPP